MINNNYEILAPAGNEESFYAAINNGANAVYLGLKEFSARNSAENFDLENLSFYVSYAKLFGVKIYLTVNTLIKEEEFKIFFKSITTAINAGIDSLIIQDIYLGKKIKKIFPNIELHLSTQAGVCNVLGALMAKENSFDRVILARETPIQEIEKIAKIIETEVFIQGALCSSFSGQCYLSSFIGGNSGNRGRCKQPCRKKYSIYDEQNKLVKELGYNISLSDLSVGENIILLKKAGVYSFKIEGRMRRAEYVGASISYYKKIFDNFFNSENGFNEKNNSTLNNNSNLSFSANNTQIDYNIEPKNGYDSLLINSSNQESSLIEVFERKNSISLNNYYTDIQIDNSTVEDRLTDLKKSYNRGDFTQGYYFKKPDNIISDKIAGHVGVEIGSVEHVTDNFIVIKSNFNAVNGDAFKLIRNGKEVGNAIYDKTKQLKNSFIAKYKGVVKNKDLVYITTDTKIKEKYTNIKKLLKVDLCLSFISNDNAIIYASYLNYKIILKSYFILQESKNQPLTEQSIKECFLKTDTYPFDINFSNIDLNNVFIQKTQLNNLRRDLYKFIFYSQNQLRNYEFKDLHSTMPDILMQKESNICILASNFKFLNSNCINNIDYVVFQPLDYNCESEHNEFINDTKNYCFKKLLYLPAFLTFNDFKIINKFKDNFDGFYLQGLICNYSSILEQIKQFKQSDLNSDNNDLLEYLGLLQSLLKDKIIFRGTGNNLFNSISINEICNNNLNNKKFEFVYSKELSGSQINKLSKYNGFVFVLGNIEAMSLNYCLLNKECKTCSVDNNFYLLDESNRKYIVKKIRLSSCRFIVYNPNDLIKQGSNNVNKFYNFSCFDTETIINILDNINDITTLKTIIKNFTKGYAEKEVN